MRLIDRLRLFATDQSGQDLIEYGLLAALIALVAVAAVQLAGNSLNTLWSSIANQVKSA
jgi:pilus assembly protein Flp/PilA